MRLMLKFTPSTTGAICVSVAGRGGGGTAGSVWATETCVMQAAKSPVIIFFIIHDL